MKFVPRRFPRPLPESSWWRPRSTTTGRRSGTAGAGLADASAYGGDDCIPAASVLVWRSITAPLGVTLGLLAAYGATCFLLYGHTYWLPMAAPMLAAALSFTGNTGCRYLTVDRELARTRGTLERYVSPQLVRHVMDNLDSIRFDGEKRKLTILFSDVRSFTTLTEKSDPVELLKQLNEYLEAMTGYHFPSMTASSTNSLATGSWPTGGHSHQIVPTRYWRRGLRSKCSTRLRS